MKRPARRNPQGLALHGRNQRRNLKNRRDHNLLRISNDSEFKHRGGLLCGNNDLQMYKCNSCSAYALLNDENLSFYLDPTDLKKVVLFATDVEIRCPRCGALDSFHEAEDDDRDGIEKSPWAWTMNAQAAQNDDL